MKLIEILKESLAMEASDIILSSWVKPCLKINWDVEYIKNSIVYEKENLEIDLFWIMTEKQKEIFKKNLELDFSIDLKWYSRFRVNAFFSKKWIWAVFRIIKKEIPKFENLWLSNQILKFLNKKNWLILVTGWVWSGKSTTLASLIDIINSDFTKHIITVEDPIEFSFENKKSLIEQREVWTNTLSFDNWLKYALRQASDVIMVWEMRDLETFRLALRAAETGNLVFATLHTAWAARTISRIIDMFPWDEKEQIKSQLASSLIWIIWQDLLKTKDWKGRVIAQEILVNSPSVQNMIRKWLTHQIKSAIETWGWDWMVTMEESLDILKNKWLI
jgi:twitching motility protein PilT